MDVATTDHDGARLGTGHDGGKRGIRVHLDGIDRSRGRLTPLVASFHRHLRSPATQAVSRSLAGARSLATVT